MLFKVALDTKSATSGQTNYNFPEQIPVERENACGNRILRVSSSANEKLKRMVLDQYEAWILSPSSGPIGAIVTGF